MSTPEHYLQVSEILKAAMDRPASERAAYLEDACAGNEALRAEVDALLEHDQDESGALADEGVGIGVDLMRAARTALGAETSARGVPTHVGGYHVERQ